MKLNHELSLQTLSMLYENEIYDENLVKMVFFAIHNTEFDTGDEIVNSYKAQLSFIFFQNHLLDYVQRKDHEKLFTLIDLFTSSCMQYDAELAREEERAASNGRSDGGERASILDFKDALRYKQ
jgi:hypothetical protein